MFASLQVSQRPEQVCAAAAAPAAAAAAAAAAATATTTAAAAEVLRPGVPQLPARLPHAGQLRAVPRRLAAAGPALLLQHRRLLPAGLQHLPAAPRERSLLAAAGLPQHSICCRHRLSVLQRCWVRRVKTAGCCPAVGC